VYLFAAAVKPFTDGEIIMSCITEVVNIVHSENFRPLKQVTLLSIQFPVEFKISVEIFYSYMKSHPNLN